MIRDTFLDSVFGRHFDFDRSEERGAFRIDWQPEARGAWFNPVVGLPDSPADGNEDFLSHRFAAFDVGRGGPMLAPAGLDDAAARAPLFVSPTEAQEVQFLNGLDAGNLIAKPSFASWKGDDPATFKNNTLTAKWGSATPGTAGGDISYFFRGTSHWTATEQAQIASVLSLWSAVTNVTFSLAATQGSAELIFTRGTDGGAYATSSFTGSGTPGVVGTSNLWVKTSAEVSIDTSVESFGPMDGLFTTAGGYVWGTIIHEVGHVLGLGHGGAYNGAVNEMTQQFSAFDTLAYTIMSYIDPNDPALFDGEYAFTTDWGVSGDGFGNTPTTMMMLDIVALQQLYGTPTSTPFSGGQTYGFNCNIVGATEKFYDFTVNTNPIVTIWNAGTGNTLDLSGFSTASTIDLNPGTFSSCDGMDNNLCIAKNTAIDNFVGGSGADTVTANAGVNTLSGGSGGDTFIFTLSHFTAADSVDGGSGTDVLEISGATSAKFGATTVLNIETIDLGSGKMKLTANDATTGSGKTLTVDASGATKLTFSGAGEKDGKFVIIGSGGVDAITGGNKNDTIDGGAASDTLTGGKGADTLTVALGNDTLVYAGVNESTGPNYDVVRSFEFKAGDHFDLDVAVAAVNAMVTTGTLSQASFNTNLAAAIGAGQLGAHNAVLFQASAGDLNGQTFLIVDVNGVAGYQASADYVMKLDTALHTANLDVTDFI
jgi:serralysin